jgi:hypothetical protein
MSEDGMEKPEWADEITWARFTERIAPDTMRGNLLKAGLFLSVFEFLKNSVLMAPAALQGPDVVDGKLVMTEFKDGRLRPTEKYLERLHEFGVKQDYFHGGALWLRKMDVLTDEDVADLLSLRAYRNQLAHELAVALVDPAHTFNLDRYSRLLTLLSKVDKWRVRLEIDINEEYDGQEIKDEDIQSMKMVVTDLLNSTVLGPAREN